MHSQIVLKNTLSELERLLCLLMGRLKNNINTGGQTNVYDYVCP